MEIMSQKIANGLQQKNNAKTEVVFFQKLLKEFYFKRTGKMVNGQFVKDQK